MDSLPENARVGYSGDEHPIDALAFSTKDWIDKLTGIVRRQYPIMAFILACAIALSLVYLFTTPKQYTAHAMFLIDTSRMRALLHQPRDYDYDQPLDDVQIETEIEILKSEQIGLAVVKDLKLTENPEFVGSQGGIIQAVFDLILSPFASKATVPHSVESENALTRAALGHFEAYREVKRVKRTYVLDLSYTSLNPATAAAVSNAIADAYLVDQLDAKFKVSSRVAKWLEQRIVELRQKAMDADSAVLAFKERKHIVDTGGGSIDGSGGRLLIDQQVVDLNALVAQARATTAEAKARLDRIKVVMTEEIPDAAVTDSLRSGIISQLRTQYLLYARRYSLYKAKYGATHLAVIALQTQMSELRQSMADELARIAQSYKSDYLIAEARQASLEKSLAQQIAGAQLTNRERLGLTELLSRAKAYHASHDAFVQRYMEVTEQQSLPTTEARVITAAAPPGAPSSPKTGRIMLIASALGLMLSFAVASMRESIDRVFRSTKQVEQILKVNCLSALPVVKHIIVPALASEGRRNLAAKIIGSTKELNAKIGLHRHVIYEPLSSFAEGCRAIKVAADISGSIKKNRVIGITSSLPREGKSTVASNFAELAAHAGRKVILIDGDLRNPTLSHRLASTANIGLLEVLSGKHQLRDAIYTDDLSGLVFLPVVIESRLAHSSEIVSSEVFRQLIEELRKSYDYIIIDLPPLAPVVDARATTHIVDSYVFVVEWGRTKIAMVQRQLGSAPEIAERLLGVVLNKANVKILDRYEDYYGSYFYKSDYYAQYGYTK